MNQELSIFNIGQNAEQMNSALFTQKQNIELFDIRVKSVGESTTFVIRPVPYVHNPLKSQIKKFFYTIPNGMNYVFFDSRATLNDPANNKYEFCEIADIWMRLKQSPDPTVQNLEQKLRRQTGIYCYVQVVNCPANPALNGKIMPMHVPIEMAKKLEELANPNDAQKALGRQPIQPYDIFKGVNLECTILGHSQIPGQVWRKWTVTPDREPSEMKIPYNGQMVNVSQVPQEVTLKYFQDNQTIDLEETFGYHAPGLEARKAAHTWLHQMVGFVPGLAQVIDNNFQDVVQSYKALNVMQQPGTQQPIAGMDTQYGQPVANQPVQNVTPPAGQPVQNVTQPVQNVAQPVANAAVTPPVTPPVQNVAQPVQNVAQPVANEPIANNAVTTPVANEPVKSTIVVP